MADAPFCHVEIAPKPGRPGTIVGRGNVQTIPPRQYRDVSSGRTRHGVLMTSRVVVRSTTYADWPRPFPSVIDTGEFTHPAANRALASVMLTSSADVTLPRMVPPWGEPSIAAPSGAYTRPPVDPT